MQGNRNCRPLYLSDAEMSKVLLKYGADVNVLDGSGRTPLDIALELLDLSCPSFEDVENVHDRISALLDHGGSITKHGEKYLRSYCDWLRRRNTTSRYGSRETNSSGWGRGYPLNAPSLARLEQVM
jgi:hypothetical protein